MLDFRTKSVVMYRTSCKPFFVKINKCVIKSVTGMRNFLKVKIRRSLFTTVFCEEEKMVNYNVDRYSFE